MIVLRFVLLTFIFCTVSTVLADVPPDPGFKRVISNIVLEPSEGFSDYRFFFRSGNLVEEIKVQNGSNNTIVPMGGGVLYRGGSLYGVQAKNLAAYGDSQGDEISEELKSAIKDHKPEGLTRVLDHVFVRDVAEKDAASVSDTHYRLTRGPNGTVTAELVGGQNNNPVNTLPLDPNPHAEKKTGVLANAISRPVFLLYGAGAGTAIGLFFIVLGIYLIRRAR